MKSSALISLLLLALAAAATEPPKSRGEARRQIVVSPNGPEDGGDFGPKTPGTRTSGLQEALLAAKSSARDVYLAGGSWTEGKTEPVVYHLHETLRVPWMQNFRLDSGHCVLNYTRTSGDAVVFDSQMSCAYRFGIIVSLSDGAVVRLQPVTAGPDRFKVITSTEFVFNALVGGGGAWPGGHPHASQLDPQREWKGVGLWLDGAPGSIEANQITVLETVGCRTGLLITGKSTRNTIEAINIHLCSDHLQVGSPDDPMPHSNRISAFMDSQGIEPSRGAILHGRGNMLMLSTEQMSDGHALVLGATARKNWVWLQGATGYADTSLPGTNRVLLAPDSSPPIKSPPVPASGESVVNRFGSVVEVRILDPGQVTEWAETAVSGETLVIRSGFTSGQSFVLNPGESVSLTYTLPPTWRWKALK